MPDQLNKQTLINLLIDSPLREPIKINLIDIVNNTSEPDLPKVFPTIVKELEIFQKATDRRLKLADETIAKLGGTATTPAPAQNLPNPPLPPTPSLPPLDLPPLPTTPTTPLTMPTPTVSTPPTPTPPTLSVPPLDLPPLPSTPIPTQAPSVDQTPSVQNTTSTQLPTPEPLGALPTAAAVTSSDEAALAEIQKELESLKAGVTADAQQTL